MMGDSDSKFRCIPYAATVMKFVEITGALLMQLAEADEIPQLRSSGVKDDSKVRINPQGDIEIFQRGGWAVIGGLLGDYQSRIRKLTGQDWS